MKTDWPIKKSGEVIVGIIFIIFAWALFVQGRYIETLFLLPFLIVLLKRDSLTELEVDFKNLLLKFKFTELLEIPINQINHIHTERIRIEPYGNEVIIGVGTIGNEIKTRFIANIKTVFKKTGTIELLINDRVTNTLPISEWNTGMFEDTINSANLPVTTNLVLMKVRVKAGNDLRIFGPVVVPLLV